MTFGTPTASSRPPINVTPDHCRRGKPIPPPLSGCYRGGERGGGGGHIPTAFTGGPDLRLALKAPQNCVGLMQPAPKSPKGAWVKEGGLE